MRSSLSTNPETQGETPMTSQELRELRSKLMAEVNALIPADGRMNSELRTKVEAMLADADSGRSWSARVSA
jgi:pentose-5-phosphate-3-epimerase